MGQIIKTKINIYLYTEQPIYVLCFYYRKKDLVDLHYVNFNAKKVKYKNLVGQWRIKTDKTQIT